MLLQGVSGLGQAVPHQGGTEPGVGLGLVLAMELCGAAAHGHALSPVYATMRDLAKGERLLERLGGRCPDTLELLQLDVTDPCSLAAAAQQVQGQRLDVLGMALPGAPSVLGVAEGTSQGSKPSPGHWEQIPNHGRCRQWDRRCLTGQRCSRWIRGCQGPINRERPPHFCLLALSGVRGYITG